MWTNLASYPDSREDGHPSKGSQAYRPWNNAYVKQTRPVFVFLIGKNNCIEN